LEYYFDQYNKHDSHRSTPQLLKDLQLTLSLWSVSRIEKLHELATFDPSKDIAQAPPQILLDRNTSQSNLKQIGLAMMMYVQDYDEVFPPMVAARSADELMYLPSSKTTSVPTVQNLLDPYTKNTELFLHPATHRPYLPNYRISRLPFAKIEEPATTLLFFEDAPDTEEMRNVAYADGHVETISEAEFQQQRKAQGISESGYPSAAKATQKAKVVPKP